MAVNKGNVGIRFFNSLRQRKVWLALTGLIGITLILGVLYIAAILPATPSIENLQEARYHQPSIMVSAEGKPLGSFRERQREWVGLDQVSPHLLHALLATEDHRFYDHHGVDITRVFGAVFYTLSGDTQGASTITQQLARNLFPEEIGRSRTVTRKVKEVLTAIKIEKAYSKEEILETYLNTVPFLYNATGIEMGARTYFNKSASQLNVTESATLVGMLKGTHYYNPVVNPQRAIKRRNLVLAQMAKHGYLTSADMEQLQEKPLQLKFKRQVDHYDNPAPHFTLFVRRWLLDWAEENDIDLSSAGLTIETTINLTLQEAAMQAVNRQAQALQQIADVEWGESQLRMHGTTPDAYQKLHKRIKPFDYFWTSNQALVDSFIQETAEFKKAVDGGKEPAAVLKALRVDPAFMAQLKAEKTRLEAGFVAMDPSSGEIQAWVGSRDFNNDQFDHVAQAARQPGSTFKPIVYGAALEQGLSPFRQYEDRQVEIPAPDGSIWRPTDMTGPTFQRMTLRDGLIFSKNSITAQVMQEVGLPNIVSLAQAIGINRSRLDPVPSLVLGTSPVTLLEMVSAYSTIATTGEYRKPVAVRRILDRNGKVLAEFSSTPQRAMTEETAVELIDIMRGVVNMGTAQTMKTRFGLVADIAGKTGTTQNNTDGWFILMHPKLVAGAWVGFNDARVTMRSSYWGQGGHNATLLVGDFFRNALKADLIDRKARFARPKRPMLIADGAGIKQFDSEGMPIGPDGSVLISHEGTIMQDGVTIGETPTDNRFTRTINEIGRILTGTRREAPAPPAPSTGNNNTTNAHRDPWADVPNSGR